MIHVGLLVMVTVVKIQADNTNTNETEKEQIKSLNEVQELEIWGDFITIVAKNVTESRNETCDAFDEYLVNHLIKIQSPVKENEYLTYELNDLIPKDEVEGRERKRKGPIRELLIPLLVALKYKSTVVLPLLLMMITFVAFKGFWAGMSGLVISKVIGLKVLLDYLNKPEHSDNETEEHDDDNQNNEEEHDNEEPIVVHLQPHAHRRKISRRFEKPFAIKRYRPLKSNYLGKWNI